MSPDVMVRGMIRARWWWRRSHPNLKPHRPLWKSLGIISRYASDAMLDIEARSRYHGRDLIVVLECLPGDVSAEGPIRI